ncbi:MAG: RraA family protein [Thermoproteota archaeon]
MAGEKISLREMCERYRKLYGGPICDVLDRLNLPNQWLHKDIKPLRLEMVVAGPAVTAKAVCRPQREGASSPDLMKIVYPGCVLVLDAGEEQLSGHIGGITANSLWAKGCKGVVVDGGIRDSSQHLAIPNWSCFCRYTSPLEQGPRVSILEVEKPIYMSGSLTSVVKVNPGDFVFGDSDGVIIIPREVAYDVLVQAEDIAARESEGIEKIRKGADAEMIKEKYRIG